MTPSMRSCVRLCPGRAAQQHSLWFAPEGSRFRPPRSPSPEPRHGQTLGASTKRDPAVKPRTGRPLSLTQVQGGPLGTGFFFLLRTAVEDRPKGPPTANHQPPPTAYRHRPPTATNRQPPPTANRQPPPTANRHQPPTATNRQPPTASGDQVRECPEKHNEPPDSGRNVGGELCFGICRTTSGTPRVLGPQWLPGPPATTATTPAQGPSQTRAQDPFSAPCEGTDGPRRGRRQARGGGRGGHFTGAALPWSPWPVTGAVWNGLPPAPCDPALLHEMTASPRAAGLVTSGSSPTGPGLSFNGKSTPSSGVH